MRERSRRDKNTFKYIAVFVKKVMGVHANCPTLLRKQILDWPSYHPQAVTNSSPWQGQVFCMALKTLQSLVPMVSWCFGPSKLFSILWTHHVFLASTVGSSSASFYFYVQMTIGPLCLSFLFIVIKLLEGRDFCVFWSMLLFLSLGNSTAWYMARCSGRICGINGLVDISLI